MLSPGALDVQDLVIVKDLFSWTLYVDVVVLTDGGNVLDIIMLSVLIALRTARIPITTPIKNADQEETDFTIDDDPTHFRRINCQTIPLGISLYLMGDTLLVDATQEEEDCVDSWVLFCVNRKKEIVNITSLYGKMDSQVLLGSLQVVSLCSDFLFQLIDSAVDVRVARWVDGLESGREVDVQPAPFRSRSVRLACLFSNTAV